MSLLEIKDYSLGLRSFNKEFLILHDICISVDKGEKIGIVGESGCGKTLLARSIIGVLDDNIWSKNGKIIFEGENLLQISEKDYSKIRGQKISMIFQEPSSSLNPVMKVGKQIEEMFVIHNVSSGQKYKEVIKILEDVGIKEPEVCYHKYPHQLSGGQKQRIVIAMALLLKPKLVIADEATTALDVTTQKRVILLIEDLIEKYGIALIFISHDISLVKQICDRIYVMYAGYIMETGGSEDIYRHPFHPYTSALIECIPSLSSKKRLKSIPGSVPSIENMKGGCPFFNRCEKKIKKCESSVPPFIEVEKDRFVRCFLYE